MATKEAIRSCWRLLAAAGTPTPPTWKTMSVDTEALMAWEAVLHDVPCQDLAKATIAYLRSADAKWWPLPGQLLKLLPQNQRAALNTADDAWGLVCLNVRKKGYYQLIDRPSLSQDPDENACIWRAIDAVGGIHAICMSSDTDDASIRSHFCTAYNTNKKRAQSYKEELSLDLLLQSNQLQII